MDARTPTIRNFLFAFRGHWFDAMSGAASVPFSAAAAFSAQTYQQIIFAVMAFACVWFAAYRIWAVEREKVIALDKEWQREAARLRSAELITEGVGLRNEALDHYNPFNDDELQGWGNRAMLWHNAVLATLKSVSPADAEWYRTLNEVPPPVIPLAEPPWGADEGVLEIYRDHNFRLKKLDQLVSGEKGNLCP